MPAVGIFDYHIFLSGNLSVLLKTNHDRINYVVGNPRNQASLIPLSLEEIIGPENEVRVIDLFVDALPLADYGFTALLSNYGVKGRSGSEWPSGVSPGVGKIRSNSGEHLHTETRAAQKLLHKAFKGHFFNFNPVLAMGCTSDYGMAIPETSNRVEFLEEISVKVGSVRIGFGTDWR